MTRSTKANKLHDKLCDVLTDLMDNGEVVEVEGEMRKRPPSAAILNVVRQFLKDNDITGIPVDGTPLNALTQTERKALPFADTQDVDTLMVPDRDSDEF